MATLEVHVVSPEHEVFAGSADMVVARGIEGDVGILPGHAPMLVALATAPLRVLSGDDEVTYLVDGGFLHVATGEGATRVDVLAEHADRAEDVDRGAAKARVDDLRRRIEEGEAEAAAELARALMHAEHGLR